MGYSIYVCCKNKKQADNIYQLLKNKVQKSKSYRFCTNTSYCEHEYTIGFDYNLPTDRERYYMVEVLSWIGGYIKANCYWHDGQDRYDFITGEHELMEEL